MAWRPRRQLLGDDVMLAHCSAVRRAPTSTPSRLSGACVSLTPSSEMAGGLGAPPIQQLIDRDIRPGLGVDDELMAPGDVFAQMRGTISVQHATVFDRKLAGKAALPRLMSTRDVIRYATSTARGWPGVGDVTGSLEPGKQADVVVLRTDRPNISPINDPIGAVVWGMDTSNVDWVFVGRTRLDAPSGVLAGGRGSGPDAGRSRAGARGRRRRPPGRRGTGSGRMSQPRANARRRR